MKISVSKTTKLPEGITLSKSALKRKDEFAKSTREMYPWSKLNQPGFSFFVPGKTAHQMRGPIYNASRRYNTSYIARSSTDGVRVYRVA